MTVIGKRWTVHKAISRFKPNLPVVRLGCTYLAEVACSLAKILLHALLALVVELPHHQLARRVAATERDRRDKTRNETGRCRDREEGPQ